jgi:DNA-binding transcriptional ArsR family regulator
MRTISSIIDVLMPRTRGAILAATLMQPDRSWYAADLARDLGMSRSSLQRELVALVKAGILKSRREGRMHFIQADQQSPVFPELRGLLSKTAGLADVLRHALSVHEDRIEICFVFGSMARAQETSLSDVDLLIVGEVGLQDIASGLRDCEKQLGREVNPKLFRADELAKQVASKDHFVRSVLSKPKLFVIGSQDELDRLIERKARRSPGNRQSRAGRPSLDRRSLLKGH